MKPDDYDYVDIEISIFFRNLALWGMQWPVSENWIIQWFPTCIQNMTSRCDSHLCCHITDNTQLLHSSLYVSVGCVAPLQGFEMQQPHPVELQCWTVKSHKDGTLSWSSVFVCVCLCVFSFLKCFCVSVWPVFSNVSVLCSPGYRNRSEHKTMSWNDAIQ